MLAHGHRVNSILLENRCDSRCFQLWFCCEAAFPTSFGEPWSPYHKLHHQHSLRLPQGSADLPTEQALRNMPSLLLVRSKWEQITWIQSWFERNSRCLTFCVLLRIRYPDEYCALRRLESSCKPWPDWGQFRTATAGKVVWTEQMREIASSAVPRRKSYHKKTGAERSDKSECKSCLNSWVIGWLLYYIWTAQGDGGSFQP